MMRSPLAEIGAAIVQARKASKRSQAALAAGLRMSRATISGIENGTIPEIGVRKLIALCGALGLELRVLPRRGRPTLNELREEQRVAKTRS
jgi:HTH-type transcriptional regulator/antitoxin HipB